MAKVESRQKEPTSAINNSSGIVWNGCINLVDISRFYVDAHVVSGCGTDLKKDISDELAIVGRIKPDDVWNYIGTLKETNNKDFVILKFHAANDEEKMKYTVAYNYLINRSRLGVVNVSNMTSVKDFFIVPLAANTTLPPILLPADGPGLSETKTDQLIAIVIRQRKKSLAPHIPEDIIPAKVTRQSHQQSYMLPTVDKSSITLPVVGKNLYTPLTAARTRPLPLPTSTSPVLPSSSKNKIATSLVSKSKSKREYWKNKRRNSSLQRKQQLDGDKITSKLSGRLSSFLEEGKYHLPIKKGNTTKQNTVTLLSLNTVDQMSMERNDLDRNLATLQTDILTPRIEPAIKSCTNGNNAVKRSEVANTPETPQISEVIQNSKTLQTEQTPETTKVNAVQLNSSDNVKKRKLMVKPPDQINMESVIKDIVLQVLQNTESCKRKIPEVSEVISLVNEETENKSPAEGNEIIALNEDKINSTDKLPSTNNIINNTKSQVVKSKTSKSPKMTEKLRSTNNIIDNTQLQVIRSKTSKSPIVLHVLQNIDKRKRKIPEFTEIISLVNEETENNSQAEGIEIIALDEDEIDLTEKLPSTSNIIYNNTQSQVVKSKPSKSLRTTEKFPSTSNIIDNTGSLVVKSQLSKSPRATEKLPSTSNITDNTKSQVVKSKTSKSPRTTEKFPSACNIIENTQSLVVKSKLSNSPRTTEKLPRTSNITDNTKSQVVKLKTSKSPRTAEKFLSASNIIHNNTQSQVVKSKPSKSHRMTEKLPSASNIIHNTQSRVVKLKPSKSPRTTEKLPSTSNTIDNTKSLVVNSKTSKSLRNEVVKSVFELHCKRKDSRLFFKELAEYIIGKFSPAKQNEIRLKFCSVVSKAELEEMKFVLI